MKARTLTVLVPSSLEEAWKGVASALECSFEGGLRSMVFRLPGEALQHLSGKSIDLLLIDLAAETGDQRGLVAVANQAHPEIPVVGAARRPVTADRRRSLSGSVFDFLGLPFENDEAAMVCRNALRWRETKLLLAAKEQELHVLDEVGRTIISSLELKTVLNIIMEKAREVVRSEAWALFLVDERTRELRCSAAIGEHAESLRQCKLKVGEGIAGWVARESKPLVIQDGSEDPRLTNEIDLHLGFQARSVLCVPLETRGKVLGALEVINKKGGGGFSGGDLSLVTKLAGFAAVAIENARLYHQAKLLTLTDELTQLYNSRFFNQFLESEVKRCRRYNSHVALIFLDLDFFKNVNDQYGHLMGSKLLQEAADVLRSGLRDVDIVARYGGDEFLVILPETRIVEAAQVARRMRQNFEEKTFLTAEGLNVKVTASFGVASFPEYSSSKEELIRFADQAMYRVKNASRNGVFVVDDPSVFSEEHEGSR